MQFHPYTPKAPRAGVGADWAHAGARPSDIASAEVSRPNDAVKLFIPQPPKRMVAASFRVTPGS